MRTLTLFLLLIILTILVVGLLPNRPWTPLPTATPAPQPQPIIQSQGPTITRLEELSHLVAIRVYVSDVLMGEGNGCRGIWLIFGDALISCDLSKAVIVMKDDPAKRATIRLPTPDILQARVDHSAGRTRTWEVKSTTWIPWAADSDSLRDEVMLHAQRLVAHAAGSRENLDRAKTAAEATIRAFYAEVGWTVTVTWAAPSDSQKPAKATP